MTHSATIVKTSTPAHLIALAPQLAGMPLRNSIVVLPFTGTRTSAALRVDLPHGASASVLRTLTAKLIGMVSRVRSADGIGLLVYTDEPYTDAFEAWDPAQEVMCRSFVDAGFDIVACLLIAGDAWDRFDQRSPLGKPLMLIEECRSDVSSLQTPTEDLRDVLPPYDPELAERVALATEDLLVFGERRTGLGILKAAKPLEPVPFLESLLAADVLTIGSERIAQLISLLQTEGDVERTILQIAFGEPVGTMSWSETLDVRRRAARSGVTPDVYLSALDPTGLSRRARRKGDLLLGRTQEIPSASRLTTGAGLLAHIAVHAPSLDQPQVYCALAWVQWARGLSSSARDMIARSSRVSPSHDLTRVFATVFEAVELPDWTFRHRDLRTFD